MQYSSEFNFNVKRFASNNLSPEDLKSKDSGC